MDADELTINWMAVVTVGVAILALLLSIFALGKALATGGSAGVADAPAASAQPQQHAVALSDFAIAPADLAAAPGDRLAVTNEGQAPHNLTIRDTGLATADLGPGGSETLALDDLAPGTYEWFCTVAGHEAAGMAGTLTVTADGAVDTTSSGDPDGDMTAAADAAAQASDMLDNMRSSIEAFPAETAGQGAAVLEPEILDDGTKLFELVVDETPWEVEPGKTVQAVAYNGIVPGPTMRVDVGDRVTVRVTNELDDEGTSLHPHGLRDHAFSIDGVTFVSQDPIEPGGTMDYTFVASEASVVTYHSHHMSLHQVPNGLFGAMIVGDYAERAGIDGVVDEQVMILNDAGNIGFSLNGKSFPATTPYTYQRGDKVIVHYANEGQMAHPMHLHNQDGTVIAKDGYLLPESARWQGDTFNVAPGERLTVVYEMDNPGTWVWHCHILSHVKQTDGSMFGMLTAVIVEE